MTKLLFLLIEGGMSMTIKPLGTDTDPKKGKSCDPSHHGPGHKCGCHHKTEKSETFTGVTSEDNSFLGKIKRMPKEAAKVAVKPAIKMMFAVFGHERMVALANKLATKGILDPSHIIKNLCFFHMEMAEDESEQIKASLETKIKDSLKSESLKPAHVIIYTMMREHDEILGFLNELEKVNHSIQEIGSYEEKREEFKKLSSLAEKLIGAEPHHKREEDVLFSELEGRDNVCPPGVMREEHKELRAKKKEIEELAMNSEVNPDRMEFSIFKEKLNSSVNFLVANLRDHIFKENNFLYPEALKTIAEDDDAWEKMKEECDKIGYCSFTPKDALEYSNLAGKDKKSLFQKI